MQKQWFYSTICRRKGACRDEPDPLFQIEVRWFTDFSEYGDPECACVIGSDFLYMRSGPMCP